MILLQCPCCPLSSCISYICLHALAGYKHKMLSCMFLQLSMMSDFHSYSRMHTDKVMCRPLRKPLPLPLFQALSCLMRESPCLREMQSLLLHRYISLLQCPCCPLPLRLYGMFLYAWALLKQKMLCCNSELLSMSPDFRSYSKQRKYTELFRLFLHMLR